MAAVVSVLPGTCSPGRLGGSSRGLSEWMPVWVPKVARLPEDEQQQRAVEMVFESVAAPFAIGSDGRPGPSPASRAPHEAPPYTRPSPSESADSIAKETSPAGPSGA